MTELAFNEEPETLAERQVAAAKTLAELARWPHCQHTREQMADDVRNPKVGSVYDFADAVERAIGRGHAPSFTWSDYHDAPNSYAWQIFCQTVADVITADEETVAEKLVDAEHRLENGVGKPTATDGSKGQWRADLSAQINTYRWLLNGESNDD